jgi:hypothetical protein
MRTARTLEAGWRQVLWGSVSTGAKKASQLLGAFGLLDFTMLCPFSLGARFEIYEWFISLIFDFWGASVKRG